MFFRKVFVVQKFNGIVSSTVNSSLGKACAPKCPVFGAKWATRRISASKLCFLTKNSKVSIFPLAESCFVNSRNRKNRQDFAVAHWSSLQSCDALPGRTGLAKLAN